MVELKNLFEEIVVEKTKITSIDVAKPKDVFGSKSRMPEDRDVLLIRTERGGREAHAVPKGLTYTPGKGWEVTDKLTAVRSLRNVNSWYRRYYDKYKSLPDVGQEVEVTLSARGFLVIKV